MVPWAPCGASEAQLGPGFPGLWPGPGLSVLYLAPLEFPHLRQNPQVSRSFLPGQALLPERPGLAAAGDGNRIKRLSAVIVFS